MIQKITLRLLPFVAQARLSPLMGLILASLLAMTAGAGLFVAVVILWPESPGSESAAPDWKPPTLAVVELDPPKPASADVQTLSRPIFSKNRRPAPKAAPKGGGEAATTAGAPAGVTVGAIVRSGKVNHAFIISPSSPDGEWKTVGDMVESWSISAIAATELTLRNGDEAAKLTLYSDATEGPPDSASPAPPESKAEPAPKAPPEAVSTPGGQESQPSPPP